MKEPGRRKLRRTSSMEAEVKHTIIILASVVAALSAATTARSDTPPPAIGDRVPRREDERFLRGVGWFIDDIEIPCVDLRVEAKHRRLVVCHRHANDLPVWRAVDVTPAAPHHHAP